MSRGNPFFREQRESIGEIPDAFHVQDLVPDPQQPFVIKNALQVREKRLTLFAGDQVFSFNTNVLLQRGSGLPAGCTGFRFINVTANAFISINGGGPRTLLDGDFVNGADIQSLQIITDATGTCTLQAWGEGDT